MKTIIAALCLACSICQADTYITTTLGSYHGARDENWNEDNRGLGFEHNGWIGGYYKNSWDDDTAYLGYAWRPLQYGYLKAGFVAAVASGYKYPVVVLPTVSIGTDNVSVDFITGPAIRNNSPTTWFVGAQLRVRVDTLFK